MSLFTRMAEGAGIGGVLGTAIGTLVGGSRYFNRRWSRGRGRCCR